VTAVAMAKIAGAHPKRQTMPARYHATLAAAIHLRVGFR